MKTSLKNRITRFLRNKEQWIHSGELERIAAEAGYKPSNAGRRCRELVNENLLEVEYRRGEAWYRAKIKDIYSVPDRGIIIKQYEKI